jgi:hypothetical protein
VAHGEEENAVIGIKPESSRRKISRARRTCRKQRLADVRDVEPVLRDEIRGVRDDRVDAAEEAQALVEIGNVDAHALADELHEVEQLERDLRRRIRQGDRCRASN